MERPDFSIEVESIEEPEVKPKIIPNEVRLVPKPLAKPVEEPYAAPSAEPSTTLAETIEITPSQSIFPHIEPYPETSPKQHHFRFKHKSDHARLIQAWSPIQIELNHGKGNVDLTLFQQNQPVGKIQFLHFDRRDRSNRSKYYVKLYLYQFQDRSMFEKAKQTMTSFFQSVGSHRSRSVRKRSVSKRSTRKHTRRHRS